MDLILAWFSPDLFSIVYKNRTVWRVWVFTGERGGLNNPQPIQHTHVFPVFSNWDKGKNYLWNIHVNGKFQRKVKWKCRFQHKTFFIGEKKIFFLKSKVFGKHDFELEQNVYKRFCTNLANSVKFCVESKERRKFNPKHVCS